MILLLNESLLLLFTIQNRMIFLLKSRKKLMKEHTKDYEFCIKVALENAKKRIRLLNNLDKKSVLDEYREWLKDGLSNHTVLLLRDDPII